ncbi:MAG: 16S rRNA (uracil(1498)-N(3))-methyltransferase [Clostridiales bacterium]|nr:16S rRNA (uracil(1498)-N(3))-methyltransferase [Clostridiales bacterium]
MIAYIYMKKFFANKQGDEFVFEGDELNHFNVLRCSVGEQILCLGEDGFDYLCEVSFVSKKMAKASIVQKTLNTQNPTKNITVFQGLVKGEKIDLIVQKLTELGVSNLFMFESEFAVAKANNNKLERLAKITKEACKQCGRSKPLNIHEAITFKQMVGKLKEYDMVLFANEKNKIRNFEQLKQCQNVAIVVGSEGGFSDKEIAQIYQAGAVNFGLGERILRAETACIATASIVGYMIGV